MQINLRIRTLPPAGDWLGPGKKKLLRTYPTLSASIACTLNLVSYLVIGDIYGDWLGHTTMDLTGYILHSFLSSTFKNQTCLERNKRSCSELTLLSQLQLPVHLILYRTW
jgi:hypothetical protein